MDYQTALTEAEQIGASNVEGLPLLALTISVLALVQAINPKLVYDGAMRRGLTADKVRKLDPVSLGDLMFDF